MPEEFDKQNKKKNKLIEQYKYTPEENEQLIVDRPSEPLSIQQTTQEKVIVKSNKELYESYIKELKNFSLSINGDVVYDSSIDRSKEYPVKFENDFFILYGKKYSYNGLKIQKINK
jgi:AAA+ superfamily predicted ATPase